MPVMPVIRTRTARKNSKGHAGGRSPGRSGGHRKMSILEVRRHAERAMGTVLTPRGEAPARALAGAKYALVVSSPLERAKRTAELIGGRLDATEPGLLPD